MTVHDVCHPAFVWIRNLYLNWCAAQPEHRLCHLQRPLGSGPLFLVCDRWELYPYRVTQYPSERGHPQAGQAPLEVSGFFVSRQGPLEE